MISELRAIVVVNDESSVHSTGNYGVSRGFCAWTNLFRFKHESLQHVTRNVTHFQL